MNGWQNYLNQFIIAIEKSTSSTGQWRLIVALAILVIGLFVLEIVFRRVRQRIHVSLEKQGRDPAAWNISAILPAVRLAATAWLPVSLWQYSAWRYLLIVIVVVLVYLAILQIGAFLTRMAIVLKESQENIRLRLVLEAAIGPVRLLLLTVAIYAVKEVLVFPPLADKAADILVSVFATLAIVLFVYRLIELMVFELTVYAARDDNLLDQSIF